VSKSYVGLDLPRKDGENRCVGDALEQAKPTTDLAERWFTDVDLSIQQLWRRTLVDL
jgi:hypothetical protein